MLESIKEKIFKNKDKDNRFISLISSVMNNYTLYEYYDQYTSEMIEAHAVNEIFLDLEEIALYLAFHLHTRREYKSLGIETELKRVYETAEKASKEIVIKARELNFTNIFNEIDVKQELKLQQLNRIDFMTLFFKRFNKYSGLIESNKNIIRVFFPNEQNFVYPLPKDFSFVDVAINRLNLPIGFLRIGFDYSLPFHDRHSDNLIGFRSTKYRREILDFENNIDYYGKIKAGWSVAILP